MQRMSRAKTVFDQEHYLRLIEARGTYIRETVPKLKAVLGLETALDAGCGVGFFAEILAQCGLLVRAFDGREQNISEARERCASIFFERGDIQDPLILNMGSFDFVLCFGLLYHLENPFLAIRHLRSLTDKCVLIESMCLSGSKPCMLLREEQSLDDQSLTDVAFYASEGCLAKMLYRAGFAKVYRATNLPHHDDFSETSEHERRRTVLLASHIALTFRDFELVSEPQETTDPWERNGNGMLSKGSATKSGARATPLKMARHFLRYSRQQKLQAVYSRWRRWLPALPLPIRLPFGKWWLATGTPLDQELIWQGGFEKAEMRFVESFLRSAMTAFDLGAHHGLYTLLLSQRVGDSGKVFAFEPSDRERKRLQRHLRLNRCSNVRVESLALGSEESNGQLFLPEAGEDWCNSLRPPEVSGTTRTAEVQISTLDAYLRRAKIGYVDFVKLDVEGAELSVLKGAHHLLIADKRPVWLIEVFDVRTKPWGYGAFEIVEFMQQRGYRWFNISDLGTLHAVDSRTRTFDANLVAVPEERMEDILKSQRGN